MKIMHAAGFLFFIVPVYGYWPFNYLSRNCQVAIPLNSNLVVLTMDQLRQARQTQELLRLKLAQYQDDIRFNVERLQKLGEAFQAKSINSECTDELFRSMETSCAQQTPAECAVCIKKMKDVREQMQKSWQDLANQQQQLLKEIEEKNKLIEHCKNDLASIETKIEEFQHFQENDIAEQSLVDSKRRFDEQYLDSDDSQTSK